MNYLYFIIAAALFISLLASRDKTLRALSVALKKFLFVTPPFLIMTIGVSLILYFLPENFIMQSLGGVNLVSSTAIASLIGSIAFIPGFIVFPLCGVLREQGVSFMVISAFTTTLMMVGVLSFPVEKKYLGLKLTVARNVAGFVIALFVALATGIIFGELI